MAHDHTLQMMATRGGVSVKTFRRTVRNKRVPFVMYGKRMRFDPFEVEAYLREQEEPVKTNVIALPLNRKRKAVVTSKKFAEAR